MTPEEEKMLDLDPDELRAYLDYVYEYRIFKKLNMEKTIKKPSISLEDFKTGAKRNAPIVATKYFGHTVLKKGYQLRCVVHTANVDMTLTETNLL